ncbi:MAG: alpha/beta hydrolase fold protein [Bacteroidetes bacterium]|nr:alpha/beta hydrolase fold protein [Bacteroidota bacterium]
MSAIILLHGAIGAADQLEPLKALLQKEGRDVYSFSFSGHGKMPFSTKGFGIEIFAEELHQFIIHHQLEKPSVFGYSMGGFVTLYLASQHPELFGRIITLGTKFDWNKETAIKESAMLNPATIEEKVPKFAEALKQRHGEENWKLLLSKTVAMMLELADKNLLNEAALKNIPNTVFVGLGDKDNMVSQEETNNVFMQLPNATMYMLAESKHPIEQVDVKLLPGIILNLD